MQERVAVTIVVEVNGEKKEFRTTATTSGETTRVANGLLSGLTSTAGAWLVDQRINAVA